MKLSKTANPPAVEPRLLIGGRLRAERERLGLTQQALADKIGVRRQALLQYESGQRSPLAETLQLFDHAGGDVNFVVTGRRMGELDEPHKQELELAMSTIALMSRRPAVQLSETARLRLAFGLAEAMRHSGRPSFSEAKVFADLRRAIDAAFELATQR